MSTTISSTTIEMTDQELVDLYKKTQDSSYFDQLYRRHSAKVYGKALSILKEENTANDAVQEIFIKVLLNIEKFKGQSKFSTWLYSISYNYCIDRVRRQKKNQIIFSEDDDREFKDIPEEVGEKELLETSIKRLKVVLNEIPVGDKAILMMKYQDEMSIKDVAKVLLISESAVKMRLRRAKQKFKLVYKEKYND